MPESHEDQETAAIAQEIRNYLMAHPNATDTVEGIVKWWLMRQRYTQARDKVQKALDYLVARDMVAKSATTGGQLIYSNKKTGVSRGPGSRCPP